jgi:hypothetical protein
VEERNQLHTSSALSLSVPVNMKLGESQNWFGCGGRNKNLWPCQELDPSQPGILLTDLNQLIKRTPADDDDNILTTKFRKILSIYRYILWEGKEFIQNFGRKYVPKYPNTLLMFSWFSNMLQSYFLSILSMLKFINTSVYSKHFNFECWNS